jgi:hypothetical protein
LGRATGRAKRHAGLVKRETTGVAADPGRRRIWFINAVKVPVAKARQRMAAQDLVIESAVLDPLALDLATEYEAIGCENSYYNNNSSHCNQPLHLILALVPELIKPSPRDEENAESKNSCNLPTKKKCIFADFCLRQGEAFTIDV